MVEKTNFNAMSIDQYRKMNAATDAPVMDGEIDYHTRARLELENAIVSDLLQRIVAIPPDYLIELLDHFKATLQEMRGKDPNALVGRPWERNNDISRMFTVTTIVADLVEITSEIERKINPESPFYIGYGIGPNTTIDEFRIAYAQARASERASWDRAVSDLANQMRRIDEVRDRINRAVAKREPGAKWELCGSILGYHSGEEWIGIATVEELMLLGGAGIDIN